MSSQLKENKQARTKREQEADHLFNQHLFRTAAYTGIGFGVGMLSSLLFKHKAGMTLLFAGTGAGYGLTNMYGDLQNFQKFKDYNNQGKSQQFSRDDQNSTKDWEQYMPKVDNSNRSKHQRGGSDDDDVKDQTNKDVKNFNRNKELDKSSQDFGQNRNNSSAMSSSHNKQDDKSSQEFGRNNKDTASSSSKNQQEDKHDGHQAGRSKHEGRQEDSKSSSHSNQDDKSNHQSGQSRHDSSSQNKHEDKSSKDTGSKQDSSRSDNKSGRKGEGQQFMTLKNVEAGKPAEGDHNLYRGNERPQRGVKNEQSRVEQDRNGMATYETHKTRMDHGLPNKAGSQFNGDNITAGSQTNTVIE